MDVVAVIVLAVIVILVFFVKRTFSGFVYSVAMIDIFLRIVNALNYRIFDGKGDIGSFISNYLPSSFESIIIKYTDSILQTVLIWGYIAIMIIFEFYIIKTFFHKK